MIIFTLTILLFALYAAMMIFYWQGWKSLPDFIVDQTNFSTTISVIIAARNEETKIRDLLEKLQQQGYPNHLFEIIVVNDHSTDNTAEVVQRFSGVKLVHLESDEATSYKKKAIAEGIAVAKNDFIITTDADCHPPNTWLRTVATAKEKMSAVFIAAPVDFENGRNEDRVLPIFQQLDFLILQGVTAVSVNKKIFSMCNGANLGYEKKVFDEVGGFQAIDKIASGDDILLMAKFRKRYPSKVVYLKSKDAIVVCNTESSWKKFFNQRLRWASKARMYTEVNIFLVQSLVYIFNLSFLVLLVAAFWDIQYYWCALLLWIAKTLVELPFVFSVAGYFNKRHLMKWFFFLQPLHIFYTIVVGFLAQFVKYEWKLRRVK
jgi:cellulose synthase/poly-beta-1,6-N-acetylglucosamine synthase-like glycosyltransferase